MSPRWGTAVLVSGLLLAACDGESPVAGPRRAGGSASLAAEDLYEGTGLVLDTPKRGPELCLGGAEDSAPPQCRGIPLRGWDWDAVEGEDGGRGWLWGDYVVTGDYDGEILVVADARSPEVPEDTSTSGIGTPCPEPAGGWAAEDPRRGSDEHLQRALEAAARGEPDFSGTWVDQYGGDDPYGTILNVAFTGDLARHERELREVWGGPLCVVKSERSQRDLRAIRKDLPETAADLGLDVLWSFTDVVDATVEIGVVVIDDAARAELDDRYGPGAVDVHAGLQPVE